MDSDGYLSQLADIFNGITVNTPSISAIIAIVLAGVLLLASGFASASEIAFFSLTPSDRNDIDEQNHPSDEKISALLGDSERLLATILITNNFVNVTIIMLCNFIKKKLQRRLWLFAVFRHRGFTFWKSCSVRWLLCLYVQLLF